MLNGRLTLMIIAVQGVVMLAVVTSATVLAALGDIESNAVLGIIGPVLGLVGGIGGAVAGAAGARPQEGTTHIPGSGGQRITVSDTPAGATGE